MLHRFSLLSRHRGLILFTGLSKTSIVVRTSTSTVHKCRLVCQRTPCLYRTKCPAGEKRWRFLGLLLALGWTQMLTCNLRLQADGLMRLGLIMLRSLAP
ncbi:hypothetical protein GGI42DRAFT_312123 [Trichoderma sp. SZMC 28013]